MCLFNRPWKSALFLSHAHQILPGRKEGSGGRSEMVVKSTAPTLGKALGLYLDFIALLWAAGLLFNLYDNATVRAQARMS